MTSHPYNLMTVAWFFVPNNVATADVFTSDLMFWITNLMLTFFASSAVRRGSEAELGASEDLFFLVRSSPNFGLKIDLCRSDDLLFFLFFATQVFSNKKTATISLLLLKNRPNV